MKNLKLSAMENPIWEVLFYVALAALLVVLFIKKRRQAKDMNDIDHNNKPKDETNED